MKSATPWSIAVSVQVCASHGLPADPSVWAWDVETDDHVAAETGAYKRAVFSAKFMTMNVSVVICCSNDFDVAKTLASIDIDAEVIVSLTPNPILEDWVASKGLKYAITPVGNHAVTANAGLELATGDGLVVMDSDCVFIPGALARVAAALDEYSIVNMPIQFADTGSLVSKAIADCRDFDNTYDRPAYKPGIAFRRDVKPQIGDKWYDPVVQWPCDAELLTRIQQHGVAIHHLGSYGIVHRPNTLKHVLRAYYHYGIGDEQRWRFAHQETHFKPLTHFRKRYRAAVKRSIRNRRFLPMMVCLDTLYVAGHLRRNIPLVEPVLDLASGAPNHENAEVVLSR